MDKITTCGIKNFKEPRLQMCGPSSLANTGGAVPFFTLVYAEPDAQRVTGRDSLKNRGGRAPPPLDAERRQTQGTAGVGAPAGPRDCSTPST